MQVCKFLALVPPPPQLNQDICIFEIIVLSILFNYYIPFKVKHQTQTMMDFPNPGHADSPVKAVHQFVHYSRLRSSYSPHTHTTSTHWMNDLTDNIRNDLFHRSRNKIYLCVQLNRFGSVWLVFRKFFELLPSTCRYILYIHCIRVC